MSLTVRKIEEMAPDQASLTAAARLKKNGQWPVRASDGGALIWGECQGSGANPYRTIANLEDLGYTCTCPSRKFPCKHVLSLLWQHADRPADFVRSPIPEWVKDWLGRRRKKTASSAKPRPGRGGSVLLAETKSMEPDLDATEQAEKALAASRAAERSRAARHRAVLGGLDDVERWILDVIGQGLAGFTSTMHDRCRTLARRLVDAKAPGLAGQVDQLPAQLLLLPEEERPLAALEALGHLHLLVEAYRRLDLLPGPLAADIRRLVGYTVKTEEVLSDPDAPRARGAWGCFGARTVVQADDLQRVESWFLRLGEAEGVPRFALLVDHRPSTAGRVVSPFSIGDRLDAELVFYPSVHPLRALIAERDSPPAPDEAGEVPALGSEALGSSRWSGRFPGPLSTLAEHVDHQRALRSSHPWLGSWPLAAGPVAVTLDHDYRAVLTDGRASLPIHPSQQDELTPLEGWMLPQVLGIFDGWTATVFTALTPIGRWSARETST